MAQPLHGVDLWLVDSLAVPASLHDLDGRFVHMNAAAERASGTSNADLRGRHFTELLPREARENVEAQFRRAVDRGEPTDFETAFVDASGALRGIARAAPASPGRRRDRRSSHSRVRCPQAAPVRPPSAEAGSAADAPPARDSRR